MTITIIIIIIIITIMITGRPKQCTFPRLVIFRHKIGFQKKRSPVFLKSLEKKRIIDNEVGPWSVFGLVQTGRAVQEE